MTAYDPAKLADLHATLKRLDDKFRKLSGLTHANAREWRVVYLRNKVRTARGLPPDEAEVTRARDLYLSRKAAIGEAYAKLSRLRNFTRQQVKEQERAQRYLLTGSTRKRRAVR